MSTQAPVPVSLQPLTSSSIQTDVAFVNKLIEKTEEGKLLWKKDGQTYFAKAPQGGLDIALQTIHNPILGSTWATFNAKNGSQDLVKIEKNNNPLASLIGFPANSLVRAIDELLLYLEGARSREVTKAISILDQL